MALYKERTKRCHLHLDQFLMFLSLVNVFLNLDLFMITLRKVDYCFVQVSVSKKQIDLKLL